MIKKKEEKGLNLDFFEKILIRILLQTSKNPYACLVMEYLDKSLFFDPNLSAVFEKIKDFFNRTGKLANKTEVLAMFGKNEKALFESFQKTLDLIKGMDYDYEQEELIANTEYFIKQRLQHRLFSRNAELYATDKSYDSNAIAIEQKEIDSIALVKDLGMEFCGNAGEFLEKLDDEEQFIKTGFPNLDQMLGGGLFAEGKAFYCFTGETNVGKSIVLSNVAWNIFEQGKNVLLISLEMSEFRYYKRIATIATGLAVPYIKQNKDGFKIFTEKIKNNGNMLIIKEFPPRRLTARGLHGFIEKLKKQKTFKPDVIIVDYHGLMKPCNATIQKHEALQLIVQELRSLSYDFLAPIISVAQLNRAGSGMDTPGLDKVAGSWDSLSDMDTVVALFQSEEDREINILRYIIQKTRDTGSKKNQGYFTINRDTLKLIDNCDGMEDIPPYKVSAPEFKSIPDDSIFA